MYIYKEYIRMNSLAKEQASSENKPCEDIPNSTPKSENNTKKKDGQVFNPLTLGKPHASK
jgi:hypothetical protein